jgi:hypothetical protein
MSFGRAVTPLWRGPSLCPCWPGSESLALWRATFAPYIMGAHVQERTTHCPRCAEPATRIVRGIPEIRSTFRISSVLASITNSVAFEESSEWGCRSCRHESGTKTNLVS